MASNRKYQKLSYWLLESGWRHPCRLSNKPVLGWWPAKSARKSWQSEKSIILLKRQTCNRNDGGNQYRLILISYCRNEIIISQPANCRRNIQWRLYIILYLLFSAMSMSNQWPISGENERKAQWLPGVAAGWRLQARKAENNGVSAENEENIFSYQLIFNGGSNISYTMAKWRGSWLMAMSIISSMANIIS